MSHGVDRVGFSGVAPQPLADPGLLPGAEGSRSGERVQVGAKSASSLVEQSLEELPAQLGEKASRKLAERTARTRTGARLHEILQKFTKAVGSSGAPERFEQLLQAIRKLGQPTPDQLKQLVGEQFKENRSAALLFLEEAFASEPGNDDLLATIRQVKAEVGAELQAFVHQELPAFEGVTDVYQTLVAQYSPDDFLRSAELLLKRLGLEMQAQGTGVEPAQLKTTLDSLYQLEVARNTFLSFSDLTQRMATSHKQTWPEGAHRLMKDLLPLKDQRWLDGSRIGTSVERLGIHDHEPKIYFLRELYSLFGGLPDKVYSDAESRLRTTGAVQEALDAAIREEDG